jgi:hypothetical protein
MAEDVGDAARGTSHLPHGGRRRPFDIAAARARTVGVLVTVVRWIGTLVALLLATHVVLTVGGANPDNAITRFVAQWAQPLALGFATLFMPADPQLAVLINYGVAALFWLVVTSLAVRILHALGGRL